MENRWWTYQRERFPVVAHGALILVLALSAVGFSVALRDGAWPSPLAVVAAFLSAFLLFLQLRVADEFKDAEEDLAHRPYRPVPRGLVTLRELALVAAGAAVAQVALALLVDARLLPVLALVWAYGLLMTKEFFVGDWLKRHHVTYLASHMVMLPLVALYLMGFDALPSWPLATWTWAFLGMTYANGIVIELGRKIRAPADEEPGVETYSALWGRPAAAGAWLAAIVVAGALACVAAYGVGALLSAGVVVAGLVLMAFVVARTFLRQAAAGMGKAIENASAGWTLLTYAAVGLLPFVGRLIP